MEKTVRGNGKWAKVSGKRGKWAVAKGYQGEVSHASFMPINYYPTKDGALIAANGWLEY